MPLKTKRNHILYIILLSSLFLTACMKKDNTLAISTRLNDEPTTSDNDTEVSIYSQESDHIESELEDEYIIGDSANLIAEPGLELYGTISSLNKDTHSITIITNTYSNNLNIPSENRIEHILKISSDTIIYEYVDGESIRITKKQLYEKESYTDVKAKYSFTIAATGSPTLYSLTILE